MEGEQTRDPTAKGRPVISLRLEADDQQVDGEILLDDLTKVAQATQKFVRQIARSLIGHRRPGRTSNALRDATALRLIGLREGSTVLDIAGPEIDESQMLGLDLPTELGELSLHMLTEGVSVLGDLEHTPELPVGYDRELASDFDHWLRSLSSFETLALESHVAGHAFEVKIWPRVARERLADAPPQPSLPFVSATEQRLRGTLYALNLNTGTFSIEDDAGHKIRLKVPEWLRPEAATFANRQVQALGNAELDEHLRLRSFEVTTLTLAEAPEALSQSGFFDEHALSPQLPESARDANDWGIEGLTDQESEDFLAALSELR